jgi:hypothetical protein
MEKIKPLAEEGIAKKDKKGLSRRDFIKKGAMFLAATTLFPGDLLKGKKGMEMPSDAGVDDVAECMADSMESVDYSRIWKKDIPVMFVGERHTDLADKDEIIRQLTDLKKQGMTHLAMEMLEEQHQETINGYIKGIVEREEIVSLLKFWDKGPGIVEKYIEMIDAAKSNGIKVVAIEIPMQSHSLFSEERDKNWARVIKNIVSSDQDARIMVFCGSGHAAYKISKKNTANEFLNSMGISSVVVKFAGGDDDYSDPCISSEIIGAAAAKIGQQNNKFGLRMNSDKATRSADYFIHLPQFKRKNR